MLISLKLSINGEKKFTKTLNSFIKKWFTKFSLGESNIDLKISHFTLFKIILKSNQKNILNLLQYKTTG